MKPFVIQQGIVKVGAVNMDEHSSVGGPYNVRGFPTIKIFGSNKNSPRDYNGKFWLENSLMILEEMKAI